VQRLSREGVHPKCGWKWGASLKLKKEKNMIQIWNKVNYPTEIIKRFWNYVIIPNNLENCWIWNGPKNKFGYGIFYYNYNRVKAHRFIYSCYNGDFDKTLFVCHKCDVPSCINPNHLFLGTPKDNSQDMVDKDRSPRGERSGTSKLTDNDVKQILTDISLNKYNTILDISKNYNIKSMQIIRILNNQNWKHVSKNFDLNNLRNLLNLKRNTGTNNPNSILNEEQVKDIRNRLKNGETGTDVARLYGVGKGRISEIKNFKAWKHVL